MKKITCILAAIMVSSMLFQAGAQTKINDSTQSLLDQLKNFPTTSISVREAIIQNFNENEQAVLFDYFANETTTNASYRNGAEVYGYDLISLDFGTFPLEGPYALNPIGSPGILVIADDFDANGNLYGLGANNNEWQLVSVSTTDGSFTSIGALTGMEIGIPAGLSYNPIDETFYMVSVKETPDGAVSQLYSVDLSSGEVTQISADMGMSNGIWLEIDNNGIAYSLDVADDMLYTVDLQTGDATAVGPFGVNLNYAQEAFIDQETNILYAATYTIDMTSAIYSIDVTTGTGTYLYDTTPASLLMASMDNLTLGVPENVLSSISISPNPVSNVINIELPPNVEISDASIYNVTGQKLLNVSNTNTIDISNLETGMYILKIKDSNNNAITRRIIKK